MSDLRVGRIEQPAYTPGPWELGPVDGPGPVEVYTSGHHRIASILATGIGATDVSKANARLIAAAPDLLKAAHAAWHALKSYQYGNAAPDLAAECAAVLEDAIAKAEVRS